MGLEAIIHRDLNDLFAVRQFIHRVLQLSFDNVVHDRETGMLVKNPIKMVGRISSHRRQLFRIDFIFNMIFDIIDCFLKQE